MREADAKVNKDMTDELAHLAITMLSLTLVAHAGHANRPSRRTSEGNHVVHGPSIPLATARSEEHRSTSKGQGNNRVNE